MFWIGVALGAGVVALPVVIGVAWLRRKWGTWKPSW